MCELKFTAPSRRQFLLGSTALAAAATLRGVAGGDPVLRERNLLARSCGPSKLKVSLLPLSRYKPFPIIQDRAAWQALKKPDQVEPVARGEKYLQFSWPALTATSFLEYARNGNRTGYEHLRTSRVAALQALVFAECVESKGRFLDDIVNGIWATCEESFWGVPAHLSLQKTLTGLPDPQDPVVDLFAAQTSALLATSVYLLNTRLDGVSPVVRERVFLETEHRIFKPLLARDFWWMGLATAGGRPEAVNNWNPWISWNWLTTSLLSDRDEDRRYQSVAKALACLDVFLDSYPDDGGCDEGPSYWNVAAGAMFDALELLYSATGGAIDIFSQPLIAQMALYMNRVHIAGNYYLNQGDASPVIHLDADKMFRFGKRLKNRDLVALAVSSIPTPYVPDSLPAIFNEAALRAEPQTGAALLRDTWLPDTRIMAARMSPGTSDGLYLACIAANNGKSHSHNDTGSFWVYSNGLPVLIDMGQETYQRNSFGPHRYEIHSMQSAYHNLPTIGGVQQGAGARFRATAVVCEMNDRFAQLKMELGTAYPPEASITQWRRTALLDRVHFRIEISDDYILTRPVADIALSLMTPCTAVQNGAGNLLLTSSQGAPATTITFDDALLTAEVEAIPLENAELQQNWGSRILRIRLKTTAPSSAGHLKVTIANA